jgi:hypothetical protein
MDDRLHRDAADGGDVISVPCGSTSRRARRLIVLAVWCALVTAAPALAARDYYVSPAGNDNDTGATPTSAWRTINRLNLVSFAPGDRIFLEGGRTHTGNLRLTADDVGSAAAPILVTTYGTGRATINAGTGTAIQIYNTAGISIRNVDVVGAGVSSNLGSGVSAYADLSGDVKLRFLHIESVNASGFGKRGIEVGGNNGSTGFEDVTIRSAAAWGNARDGIMTYGPVVGTHRNVYVGYSRAFSNPGLNASNSTGNGIVLGGVDGAVIERCVAHHNGASAAGPHGPVGIWTYYSNDVTIQFNESYDNRTAGWADGGGFALDVGVTNSRLQYNYSHGNHGAGLMLAGGFDALDHAGNLVRYNISQNDGRRNGYGAIEVWGKTRSTHVYNNTVFAGPDAALQSRLVYITNDYAAGHYPVGVSFRNNIFYAAGGVPHLRVNPSVLTGGSLRFEGNNYYAASGAPRIEWGGTTFTSLAAWAGSTGQETAGSVLLGTSADPLLVNPGGGRTFDDATMLGSLTEYGLRSGSSMIDAGRDLRAVGLPAVHDFYGTPVPEGAAFDTGAHERLPGDVDPAPAPEIVLYASDITTVAGNWHVTPDATAAGGSRLQTADLRTDSWASPFAAPADFVEVTFDAPANTRYRLWLRLRAHGDSKYNDSVYVQFSDALSAGGAPAYRIGSTSALTVKLGTCSSCPPQGWGWTNRAYWLPETGDVWFATSGTHTLRIQIRGDGVALDQVVLSPARYLETAPGSPRNDTVIVDKSAGPPPPPPPAPPAEVVLYAADVGTAAGNWRLSSDATAAGGQRLQSADLRADSWPAPLAAPADFVEVTFAAVANTRYRLWLRLVAENDSKYNDSVYVQFSDAVSASGSPIYGIGTTSALTAKLGTCSSCPPQGWGWTNRAYWLPDTGDVWFAASGTHTLRIQIRGDGVGLDQIVLSPSRYVDLPPGPNRNDTVIVPKP